MVLSVAVYSFLLSLLNYPDCVFKAIHTLFGGVADVVGPFGIFDYFPLAGCSLLVEQVG